MKKILFFLAFLALGILSSVESEAQATYGTNTSWNLDTIYTIVPNSATRNFLATRSFTVGSNNLVIIQGRVLIDYVSSGTFVGNSKAVYIQGSMDNTTWTNVPYGTNGSNGCWFGGLSTFGTCTGSYPSIVPPAIISSGTAATMSTTGTLYSTAGVDSLSFPLAGTTAQGFAYHITIMNPSYTYYRIVYSLSATGGTPALRIAQRYYFRKPY